MASRDIKDLHPVLAESFNRVLAEWSLKYPTLSQPFLTCTHRPNAEQNALYAIGRTVKGKKVTNARGGQSPHNYLPSLAYDVGFKNAAGQLDWNIDLFKKFAELVEIDNASIVWGGSWKFTDNPHFELPNWKTLI
jgi:peptidoglycan L-alanyl-D-glutamate endopeptidase CwlK